MVFHAVFGINTTAFSNHTANTMQVDTAYENVKEMWEGHIMYVADIDSCVKLYDGLRVPMIIGITALKNLDASYRYYDSDDTPERKRFLQRWLHDETRRTVQGIVFEPRSVPGYYNIFDGFVGSKLARIDADDSPVVDVVRDVLASGSAASSDFIMKWLAHIVKKPMEMTRIAPCFCGVDDECMNIFFEFIVNKIIGIQYAAETVAPKHALLSRFGTVHHYKVLVVVTGKYDARIDKLFTEPTYEFRTKGSTPTTMKPNHLNIAFCQDKKNITADMRQNQNLAVFDCGVYNPDRYAAPTYDGGRCDTLRDCCDDPAVAAAFYNRLMNMDLSGFVPRQAAAALQ
jgi:hypothetical protein